MTAFPIPKDALDDRLGIVGTAGSGKTYTAMLLEERVLDRKGRVIHVDPLGVSWGLRLMADGRKKSPYKIVIFGGPHGDLALTEHAGALIGKTVATMAESCIIDLSQLGTKAAERRFMLAFTTALYKNASGEPVHLIFDEVDMFAPQKLLDKDGDAARLLGMMETIVRRGRRLGFIPWLISQRPAVINKDILSQVDGLIAMKLTASQDRKALGAWIEGQADVEEGKKILADLPTKQKGEGVVWIPGRSILNTVQFPEKLTFDSSRTPKRGERVRKTAKLERLDITELQDKLKAVEVEVKANDPKALKRQVSELTATIAKMEKAAATAKPATPAKPDKDAITAAEKRGFDQAQKKLRHEAEKHAQAVIEEAMAALDKLISPIGMRLKEQIGSTRKQRISLHAEFTPPAALPTAPYPGKTTGAKVTPIRPPAQASRVTESDVTYSGAQMKVLRSLAMWKALGHDAPTREMVAAVAGYSPSSGGFNNLLGGLGTMGVIGKPSQGRVSLLVEGVDIIDKDEGRELLIHHLSNPQRKIIGVLVDDSMKSREFVAEQSGYSPSSGGYNNLIGSLSTLGIITKPQRGHIELSEWAQELLTGCRERLAA